MPKLIDADEFKRIAAGCVFETPKGIRIKAEIAIDARPAVDAEPVRHGEWKCIGEYEEFSEEMADYLCVNCGYVISRLKNQKPNFCENCGRDMRATDTNVGGKGGNDNA